MPATQLNDGTQEERVMRRLSYTIAVAAAILLSLHVVRAEEDEEREEREQLAKAMSSVKISLADALAAAAASGTVISAKFEVEDGPLQLSVYAEKDGKFSEVIVDHQTGKAGKPEAITEDEDLAEAKAQSGAMAKTKLSLKAVVEKVAGSNKGFTAVSVTPMLKDGHPLAEVVLVKGQEWKTAMEKLD
jgi:uncharacterized membrane protein YkoI